MSEGYPYLVKSLDSLPRGLGERRPRIALNPDQPRVSVYCLEASHKGIPWFVASFVRRIFDGQPRWVWDEKYPTVDGFMFWIGDGSVAKLVGDTRADPADNMMESYRPDFRVNYALECKICGLRKVRHPDVVQPVLETLWTANHRELSLRGLMGLLR